MKTIYYMSLYEAEKFIPEGRWVAISIADPKQIKPQLHPDFEDVLSLRFLDVDDTSGMMKHDAQMVIQFLEKYLPEHVNILIHCQMGISRSAAIAQFIGEHCTHNTMERYKHSNQRVLTLLRRETLNWHGDATILNYPYDTKPKISFRCTECDGLGHVNGQDCTFCTDGSIQLLMP